MKYISILMFLLTSNVYALDKLSSDKTTCKTNEPCSVKTFCHTRPGIVVATTMHQNLFSHFPGINKYK
jgi:hypothetical protein